MPARCSTLFGIALAVLAACGDPGSAPRGDTSPPRHRRPPGAAPDADLLALVPDGAHLLVTVDLRRLRRFWRARPWSRAAGAASGALTRRLPGDVGDRLLARADVLVLALWLDEGTAGKLLVLARGADRGQGALGLWTRREMQRLRPKLSWSEYRRVPLADGVRGATAVPSPRTVIAGPAPQVKHALDLLRAVPGYASAREDRVLMALWRKVTGPRTGRAPLIAVATRFPAPMQDRMRRVLGLKAPPIRGAFRLSASTWLTLRGLLDCPDTAAATRTIERLRKAVQRAVGSRLARSLGIVSLLRRLQVHQEGARVHLQWFAPVKRVDPSLARLVPLLRALRPAPAAPPPRKKR